MKTGKIRIKDKVYFEPDGLPKPDKKDYSFDVDEGLPLLHYKQDVEEYEASKQIIEVSNVEESFDDSCILYFKNTNQYMPAIDNIPCKAEVIGDKATIVELIK